MRIAALAISVLLLAAACRAETPRPRSLVVYGDSFSLGTGTGHPPGWPDRLEAMLDRGGRDWSVINRSINGNGLVWRTRCFGEPALARLRSEWPEIEGDRLIVVMAGVNDVIQPNLPAGSSDCFDPADFPASSVIGPLDELRQSSHGRRILLATIPPSSGSEFHSPAAEARRTDINRWIEANWPRVDVIDLARLLASPDDPSRLNPDLDSGDGLHPNDKGASVIAAAVMELIR